MEFSPTITSSDIIASVATLISLVSIFISIRLANKSDKRVAEANETANKALKMAEFDYKEKIQPFFKAKALITVLHGELFSTSIYLQNVSRGQAKITRFRCNYSDVSLFDNKKNEIVYPFILGYNNYKNISLQLPNIEAIQDEFPFVILEEIEDESFEDRLKRSLFFIVFYTDKEGTEYKTYLHYNKELDVFDGEPEELAHSNVKTF